MSMPTTPSSSHYPDYDDITPVLIVGGSLVGLSTSLFLSRHGIASLLVGTPSGRRDSSARGEPDRTDHGIFRAVGAESAIRQVEPPFSSDSNVPLVESLVGKVFDTLMEDMSAYFTPASPVRGSLIAQDVLDSVLLALAKQAGGDLRYGTELVAFEQDEAGITATIRDLSSGTSHRVRALSDRG